MPGARLEKAGQGQLRHLLSQYSCFVFDCDGTLWKGEDVLPGILETLEMLRRLGKKLLYVTNNSTKSRLGYAAKFERLNISVKLDEIYSSSYAAAAYLASNGLKKKVYVVGAEGIGEELALQGIESIGGPADADKAVGKAKIEVDSEVQAVVVGVDPKFSYYKAAMASLCLRSNPGCVFVATNTDARGHFCKDQEWPGAGAMVAAVRCASEKEPVVVGKPSEFLLLDIEKTHGVRRSEMLIVGDRLDTDILWGATHGVATLAVLTGVTSEELLRSDTNTIIPDYFTYSLADLLQAAA